jgi:hypothetical protein
MEAARNPTKAKCFRYVNFLSKTILGFVAIVTAIIAIVAWTPRLVTPYSRMQQKMRRWKTASRSGY